MSYTKSKDKKMLLVSHTIRKPNYSVCPHESLY